MVHVCIYWKLIIPPPLSVCDLKFPVLFVPGFIPRQHSDSVDLSSPESEQKLLTV